MMGDKVFQKAYRDGGKCSLCHDSFNVGDPLWPYDIADQISKHQKYAHLECAATHAGGVNNLRPPVCKHWRKKGTCAFGDSCFFSHNTENVIESLIGSTMAGSSSSLSEIGNIKFLNMKKKRKPVANDSRAFIFRAFLIDTFGLNLMQQGTGVLDVGGGHGELAFQIVNLNKVPATVVDPRPLGLRRFARRASFGMYTRNSVFNKYNHSAYETGCVIPPQNLLTPNHLRILFEHCDTVATGKTKVSQEDGRSRSSIGNVDNEISDISYLDALVDKGAYINASKLAESKAWTRKGLHEKAFTGCEEAEGGEESNIFTEDRMAEENQTPSSYIDDSTPPSRTSEELLDDICEQWGSSSPSIPFEKACDIIKNASLVVGLHPDQAASEIVAFARKFQKPFAVIPCCTYSRQYPFRRLVDGNKLVTTYDDLVQWCLNNGPPGTRVATLNFEGKNKVVYWKPDNIPLKELYTKSSHEENNCFQQG